MKKWSLFRHRFNRNAANARGLPFPVVNLCKLISQGSVAEKKIQSFFKISIFVDLKDLGVVLHGHSPFISTANFLGSRSSPNLPAFNVGNRLGQILDHRFYRTFIFNNVFMTQSLCCVKQDVAVPISKYPSVGKRD